VSTIDGESLNQIAIHSFEKNRQIESAIGPSRTWQHRLSINSRWYILHTFSYPVCCSG